MTGFGFSIRRMNTKIHQYVLDKLAATKGRWRGVAEGSGVSYHTIIKIASREHRYPRVNVIEQLAEYFHEQDQAEGVAEAQ